MKAFHPTWYDDNEADGVKVLLHHNDFGDLHGTVDWVATGSRMAIPGGWIELSVARKQGWTITRIGKRKVQPVRIPLRNPMPDGEIEEFQAWVPVPLEPDEWDYIMLVLETMKPSLSAVQELANVRPEES